MTGSRPEKSITVAAYSSPRSVTMATADGASGSDLISPCSVTPPPHAPVPTCLVTQTGAKALVPHVKSVVPLISSTRIASWEKSFTPGWENSDIHGLNAGEKEEKKKNGMRRRHEAKQVETLLMKVGRPDVRLLGQTHGQTDDQHEASGGEGPRPPPGRNHGYNRIQSSSGSSGNTWWKEEEEEEETPIWGHMKGLCVIIKIHLCSSDLLRDDDPGVK
ncbi:hypothetical protein EYF80_037192 [Liparis tanakae]|uniref:Uncharacterized protein n=1 Tax=Liparis tanakae TaxID=230148 RepID=A0A4Z2GIL2_9TELE|nr:hypothetical protein EYF80_037192 [Liparis tanakae]